MISNAAHQAAADAIFAASSATSKVLVYWEATNDIKLGATQTAARNNLRFYGLHGTAVGYTAIVALTILPRTEAGCPANQETDRLAINANMRAYPRAYGTSLCDVGADAVIGFTNASNQEAWYVDKVHMTSAGYHLVAQYAARSVAQAILGRGDWARVTAITRASGGASLTSGLGMQ
jgi:hypothetical protein